MNRSEAISLALQLFDAEIQRRKVPPEQIEQVMEAIHDLKSGKVSSIVMQVLEMRANWWTEKAVEFNPNLQEDSDLNQGFAEFCNTFANHHNSIRETLQ